MAYETSAFEETAPPFIRRLINTGKFSTSMFYQISLNGHDGRDSL